MRTFGLTLDGIAPETLDPCIRVTDVAEDAPDIVRSTAHPAGRGGSLVLREERRSLTVHVRLLVRERDAARRALLMERLCGWASGTELRLLHRPGRRLLVRCSSRPGCKSAADWAGEVTVSFTAWSIPWWQDAAESTCTLIGNGSADWYVGGTAPQTPCAFRAEVTGSEACTALRITAGDTVMAFAGLMLRPGDVLEAAYDAEDIPCVKVTDAGGMPASAAPYLTRDSSDRLCIACGKPAQLSAEADAPVRVTFSARGRYL